MISSPSRDSLRGWGREEQYPGKHNCVVLRLDGMNMGSQYQPLCFRITELLHNKMQSLSECTEY